MRFTAGLLRLNLAASIPSSWVDPLLPARPAPPLACDRRARIVNASVLLDMVFTGKPCASYCARPVRPVSSTSQLEVESRAHLLLLEPLSCTFVRFPLLIYSSPACSACQLDAHYCITSDGPLRQGGSRTYYTFCECLTYRSSRCRAALHSSVLS